MAVVGLLKGNVEDERSDSEDYSSEEEGKKSNGAPPAELPRLRADGCEWRARSRGRPAE